MKYITVLFLLLFGLFWVVSPENIKDKIIGLLTFASNERQCFNYYKNDKDYFKDPDSAYIVSSVILEKSYNGNSDHHEHLEELKDLIYDSILRLKVRARNSIGGYATDNIDCPLLNNKILDVVDFARYELDESNKLICLQPNYPVLSDTYNFCSKYYPKEQMIGRCQKRDQSKEMAKICSKILSPEEIINEVE